MNEAAIETLVTLLDRVRERSRSTWPAVVEARRDDEAHGHAAFEGFEDPGSFEGDDGDDTVVESSPRIKIVPVAGPPAHAFVAPVAEGEPPVLEILEERSFDDAAGDDEGLLAHVTLGELLVASLALRPRADAW